jgi:carboxylate-amine ligase
MGVEEVFSQARRILRQGTSAERQRNVYRQVLHDTGDAQAALAGVVDQLLRETAEQPCLSNDPKRAVCES